MIQASCSTENGMVDCIPLSILQYMKSLMVGYERVLSQSRLDLLPYWQEETD